MAMITLRRVGRAGPSGKAATGKRMKGCAKRSHSDKASYCHYSEAIVRTPRYSLFSAYALSLLLPDRTREVAACPQRRTGLSVTLKAELRQIW